MTRFKLGTLNKYQEILFYSKIDNNEKKFDDVFMLDIYEAKKNYILDIFPPTNVISLKNMIRSRCRLVRDSLYQ